MYGIRGRIMVCVLLASGASLSGCDDSAPQPPVNATAVPKPATKASGGVGDMVAAVSAGKTATAVGVYFTLGNAPTVNTALPVDIAIVPHQDFTSLRAHFEGQDGLILMSGDKFGQKANPRAEEAIRHQLVLMPAKTGVYVISAILETEGVEGTVSRVFSMPVIIAPAAQVAEKPPAAPAPAAAPTAN